MIRPVAVLVLCLTLAACATGPVAAPAPAAPRQEAIAAASERAARFERRGELRQALWWWAVVDAIGPNQGEAAKTLRAELQRRVVALTQAGDRFRRSGARALAGDRYEAALSLDPTASAPRAALRAMSTEAALRDIARGGGGGPAAPRAR